MKLISRYLRREILLAIGFVLVAFLALFAFFDFIGELERVGRAGYRVQHAIAFVLLGVPTHIYELMPIVALIGSIYALSQLAANSEFTAMRAAGFGRRNAIFVATRIGLLLALFTALVGEVVTPPVEQLGRQMRTAALGGSLTGEFRSGLWVRDTVRDVAGEVQANRFVNIQRLMADGSLQGVRIHEFGPDMRLAQIVEASSASYGVDGYWQLINAVQWIFDDVTAQEGTPAVATRRVDTPSLSWRSEIRPHLLGVLLDSPESMSAFSLAEYISHLRSNSQSTHRFEVVLWKKIIYPLAVVAMMGLALPFAYLQVRSGGTGFKVFAGVMLGIAFHFMNGLFSHLGMLNTWPPSLAVSIPTAVAIMVSLVMLWRVDRTN